MKTSLRAAIQTFLVAMFLLASFPGHSGVPRPLTTTKTQLSEKEMVALRIAAEKGVPEAQALLGLAFELGLEGREDQKAAADWYGKAAAQGFAGAQLAIGAMYEEGRGGLPKDLKLAAEWYLKSAEQGDADAQNRLGVFYENGSGVPKDIGQAVKWYRRAAELFEPYAQTNLGALYEYGRGVELDMSKAFVLYKKAAEQGYGRAQRNLGLMYAYGRGVAIDYAAALAWYAKAAQSGDDLVPTNLGWLYENGWGVPKDDAKAAHWYQTGADRGDDGSQLNLAVFLRDGRGLPKDERMAAYWFRRAAEQGNASAQFNLALMYRHGQGVAQDYTTAVQLYLQAAAKGETGAMRNLGFMYAKGFGVPKDPVLSAEWYARASQQKLPEPNILISERSIQSKGQMAFSLPDRKESGEFAGIDPKAPNESKKAVGKFEGELIFTDDAKTLIKKWNASSDDVVLNTVETVQLDKTIEAFVIFDGCTADANKQCNVSLSYLIYYPDGNLYSMSSTQFPMNKAPADMGAVLGTSTTIRLPATEPVGDYVALARLRDLNSAQVIELRRVFHVTK